MGEDEPEALGQLAAGILIRRGQRCHQLSFFCIPRGAESITPVCFYCIGLCSRLQGTEESLREGEPDEPGRLDCGQGPHWTAALPSRAQHPRLPSALCFTSSCMALALISPSGAALPLTTTRPCPSSLPTASRTASHRWLRFLSTVKHLEFPSQKSDATHVYHHVRPGDPVSACPHPSSWTCQSFRLPAVLAIPIMRRRSGVMLCLLVDFFPEEVMSNALTTDASALVGPNTKVQLAPLC